MGLGVWVVWLGGGGWLGVAGVLGWGLESEGGFRGGAGGSVLDWVVSGAVSGWVGSGLVWSLASWGGWLCLAGACTLICGGEGRGGATGGGVYGITGGGWERGGCWLGWGGNVAAGCGAGGGWGGWGLGWS